MRPRCFLNTHRLADRTFEYLLVARGNSVCRLLKAIWVGPGFRLGVIKVIGRMPALCDVDMARSPALSLCKVCSSLKVE